MMKAAIEELDWEILPYPPYSPDLIPTDYYFFCSLSFLSFNNYAELRNWLYELVAKPVDLFKRGIKNLPERWEAVVNNGGEHIID
jgi:hypothetical protein